MVEALSQSLAVTHPPIGTIRRTFLSSRPARELAKPGDSASVPFSGVITLY